jgi:hypothetical protein
MANMKELRPPSGGRSEVRILFVFDPWRSAVLLVAGDKSGQWARWYRSAIPQADGAGLANGAAQDRRHSARRLSNLPASAATAIATYMARFMPTRLSVQVRRPRAVSTRL